MINPMLASSLSAPMTARQLIDVQDKAGRLTPQAPAVSAAAAAHRPLAVISGSTPFTAKQLMDIAAKVKANAAGEVHTPILQSVPEKLADTIMAALDTDGDGAINSAELKNPRQNVETFDMNGDQRITRDELARTIHENLSHQLASQPDLDITSYMNQWLTRFGVNDATAADISSTSKGVGQSTGNVPTSTSMPAGAMHAADVDLGRVGGVLTMPGHTGMPSVDSTAADIELGSTGGPLQMPVAPNQSRGQSSAAEINFGQYRAAQRSAVHSSRSASDAVVSTGPVTGVVDQSNDIDRGDRQMQTFNREYYSRLSADLSAELDEAGFASRPPTNIRALIANFGLESHGTQLLMKMLQSKYPAGLGVNLRG